MPAPQVDLPRQIHCYQECARARVKPIAQGVPEQIERQNRCHDRERGKQNHVGASKR